MAPKATKRPAAARASVGNVQKQARVSVGNVQKQKSKEITNKCQKISSSLQVAAGLAETLRNMLIVSVEPALSEFKDQRHPHQDTVVAWIGEALSTHQSSLQSAVSDAKSNLDGIATESAACQTVVSAAEESLVGLSGVAATAQEVQSNASAAVDEAATALKAAQNTVSDHAQESDAAAQTKQQLEALVSEEGTYIKMKAVAAKKKDVDALMKLLKKHKFEGSLLQTLSPVLIKEPATRTEFDNLVLRNLEETVAQQIAAQTKIIDDATPRQQQLAAETAAAEAVLSTAQAAAETSEISLQSADAAVNQGEVALKGAKKSLKAFGPAAKEAAHAVKQANSAVEDFSSETWAVFEELRDRCAPVELPEVVEPTIDDQTSVGPPVGDAHIPQVTTA